MVITRRLGRTPGGNTVRHQIARHCARSAAQGQTVVVYSGCPAPAKSSVAMLVERKLLEKASPLTPPDGDNLRHGLSTTWAFHGRPRGEPAPALSVMATLLADCGHLVLVPAISPCEAPCPGSKVHAMRESTFEVFCDTPLQDFNESVPKGCTPKARAGESHFTGDGPPQRPTQTYGLRRIAA